MKKLIACLILMFVIGCAGAKIQTYNAIEGKQIYEEVTPKIHKAFDTIAPTTKGGFDVAKNPVPNTYFVACSPPRLIVNEGLLNMFDQDELVLIFSHEASHVKLSHCQKKAGASLATTAGFLVLNFFVPGSGLLNHAVNPILTNAFSRDQEIAADLLAVESMYKAYSYDPSIYIGVLEKLALYAKDHDIKSGGIFSSHPDFEDRIKAVKGYKDSLNISKQPLESK